MMKLIKIVLGVLITTFVLPQIAMAAAGPLASQTPFALAPNDHSLQYLGQILGSPGGGVAGTSGNLLGQIFLILNYGLLLVASAFLTYATIKGVLETSTDGEFMGRQTKGTMLMMRLVIGTSALVPMASGYSVIQSIVMWVCVQGVGLADQAWDHVLTYLQTGAPVYSAPLAGSAVSGNLPFAGSILQSEVCLLSVQHYKGQQQAVNQQANQQAPAGNQPSYDIVYTTNGVSFGATDPHSSAYNGCGYYAWNLQANSNIQSYQQSAIKQVVIDMLPIARSMVDLTVNPSAYPDDKTAIEQTITANASNALANAARDYTNIMMPAYAALSSDTQTKVDEWFSDAKSTGWITAGQYYYQMGKIGANHSDQIGKIQASRDTESGDPASTNTYTARFSLSGRHATEIGNMIIKTSSYSNGAQAILTTQYDDPKVSTYSWGHKKKLKSIDDTATHPISGQAAQSATKMALVIGVPALAAAYVSPAAGIPLVTLVGVLSAVGSIWVHAISTANTDPILMLMHLGHAMLTGATVMWVVMIVSLFITGAIGGVACDVDGIGEGILASVFAVVAPIMGMMLAMIVLGVTFSVYIPLLPFIIFFFAAVGWMISVIEAMVAAPLVALGITHPEGHDLLGKAEQAIMLLLGVMLRPILILTGLVAGMILSRVAIRFLNVGFNYITGTVDGLTSFGNIFGFFGMLFVYTMIMVSVVNMSFSLIHAIPDRIMRWLGLSPDQNNIEQMMQQVKQGAEGGMQSGGGLMKDPLTGLANKSLHSGVKQKGSIKAQGGS